MDQPKVINHGEEVITTPPGNPPPYTAAAPGPAAYGPAPYGPTPYGPAPYGTTVVQATVIPRGIPVVVGQHMGPNPARMTCKSCQYEIVTRVETKPTMRTHLFAALLCLLGCWPCVCVPYCMDSCMNTDHYCPNCNAYVGSYLN